MEKLSNGSRHAVIRVYDDPANVIETREHTGDFKRVVSRWEPCLASAETGQLRPGLQGGLRFDKPLNAMLRTLAALLCSQATLGALWWTNVAT